MTAPLTPARLSEIRARAEAATAGEWSIDYEGPDYESGTPPYPYAIRGPLNEPAQKCGDSYREQYGNHISEVSELTDADVVFIAAARLDVPDLLAEVDRLTAALEVAEKAIERLRTYDVYPKAARVLADYDAAKEVLNHE